jgi:hypothetical protein
MERFLSRVPDANGRMSDDDKDEAIFKVETVPPPAGESDAYNAPTKVGPMAAAVVEEMMHAAVRKSTELSQRADEKRAAMEGPGKATASAKPSAPVKSDPVRAPAPISGPSPASTKPQEPVPVSRPPTSTKTNAAAPSKRPVPVQGSGYSFGASDLVHDVPSSPPSPPSPPSKPAAPPPRVYDDEEEDDNAATMLSLAAKAPVVKPIASPPLAPRTPIAAPHASDNASAASAPPTPASTPPESGPLASTVPSPFAIPQPQSALTAWLPVIVGFGIFFVGLALYLWAR